MARWKAWLCRFGMPGRTTPASRSAPAALAPGLDRGEIALRIDLEPDVRGEARRQQRGFGPEHRHWRTVI